ncbi:16S rRNA (guanine(966)-N(2))-methyltransferase RsmD [Leifsonia xyli subsp. xyli]|uniref:DNA methyltransferase n=2 Tax=Leifsonia xyli subsp. xyli TaxID=59736 RepID=Q6AFJ9_LEIXX|nr:16S rRNA (guanine(966)-N(2))-methyltransferase RsmD [Leifsonia xyli]AAT88846.1 DNA methyltransferase [Leifsonia xyli subsp. xyli str. CTCB07]ODA90206.1 16S rRNA (guanine(966)-N(2))-methyltransferase RsmD [Leifsonia xyli subsp. xyli]
MTRIVSGFAGSLALQVPKSGTRPTSDRVREAVFSALESRDAVRGARVLDLYAGSGALGLEAASRGSGAVVLVEKSAAAASVCKRNAAAVVRSAGPGEQPSVDVRTTSALAYLTTATGRFDLVFLDPPYDAPDAELLAVLTALVPLLAPDALVCVERSAREGEPSVPDGLERVYSRTYGETALHYLEPAAG